MSLSELRDQQKHQRRYRKRAAAKRSPSSPKTHLPNVRHQRNASLAAAGFFRVRHRVFPSFVPRITAPNCCSHRSPGHVRLNGSGGGTGNYRRLWAVEAGWRGLFRPRPVGSVGGVALGQSMVPRDRIFPPDREENVRLTFRPLSDPRHAKGEAQ